jgi:alpha-beta hydrolase superfamily lysophospholipase
MRKEEFYYDSADKTTRIHAVKWIPDGNARGVLQITHGMLEHIERYDDFATAFTDNGIIVAGNDHLGHGMSVTSEDNRGYFCEHDGNKAVLEDIHSLTKILKTENRNVPYFILGHSMGSYLIRQYLATYNEKIDGVIITGTGQQPYALLNFGLKLTWLMALVRGWRYRSKLVDYLALGRNNRKIKSVRTKSDWLSKDENVVDKYLSDKKNDFIFTLNSYHNMFKGIIELYDMKNLEKMDRNIPIILLSGQEDPVGNYGKDVPKIYESYRSLGIMDVSYKLYENDRHEIINETDRQTVYNDIKEWINHKIDIKEER